MNTDDITDPIVREHIADHAQRAAAGLAKYGHDLSRDDLTLEEWLMHGCREAMDLGLYLRRAAQKAETMRAELVELRERLRRAGAAQGIHVWTPCSVRMPTKEDEDVNGYVWAWYPEEQGIGEIIPAGPELRSHDDFGDSATHWTQTGLRRPEPPQPE